MLGNLKIAPRLGLLIGVQLAILLIIGLFALNGLRSGSDSTQTVFLRGQALVQLNEMAENISNLQETANRVNTGAMTWGDGRERLNQVIRKTSEDWDRLSTLDGLDQTMLSGSLRGVTEAHTELTRLFDSENTGYLSLFVLNDLAGLIDPFKDSLKTLIDQGQAVSAQTYEDALDTVDTYFWISILLVVGALVLTGFLAFLIYRSIVDPMKRISLTVLAVSEGDFDMRSHLQGSDEIAELGTALDQLLEDKVTTLARAEEDNDNLNTSVYRLLEAVAQLSERDLTVSVPVSKDVTGSVADAINQMVEEIATVLDMVNRVANQVGRSSKMVYDQTISMNDSVKQQKNEVEETSRSLADASEHLNVIASTATECDNVAVETSGATRQAAETVSGTLSSMNDIRESIQETGKRIKRLGERSQEISAIVDIINTLSERTHVLALNASMQAAAAGEAGRGFAVVAEEVQRLAQSSRDATGQIADLVKNIQIDTNDTIQTMDKTISTVVAGSSMAETAGQQMSVNLANTDKLVSAVNQIAQESKRQAEISTTLSERAHRMMESSEKTSQDMEDQMEQTKRMLELAKRLLMSVKVFKLPQLKKDG